MKLASSSDGIIEYQSTHFNSQMRGNLIVAKYKGQLFRIILSPDGKSVVPSSNPAIGLGGDDSLDIALAPDGTIIDARFKQNVLYYYEPIEPPSSALTIYSVFPRRGGLAGGTQLSIYGANFAGALTVTIGGKNCSGVDLVSPKKITCTIPLGNLGAADVTVTGGAGTYTMTKAYRYITGTPENPAC